MAIVTCPKCLHEFDPAGDASGNPAKQMHEAAKLLAEGRTQAQVAKMIGKTQAHVSKLLLVRNRTAAKVLNAWEESWDGPVRVPLNAMVELGAKIEESKQMAEYRLLFERAKAVKEGHRMKHTVPRARRRRSAR